MKKQIIKRLHKYFVKDNVKYLDKLHYKSMLNIAKRLNSFKKSRMANYFSCRRFTGSNLKNGGSISGNSKSF